MALDNVLPTKGRRKHLNFPVDEDGVEVSPQNDRRGSLVLYNVGPDTAWGNTTLETATPEEGFPLLAGAGVVEDDSIDAWCFRTASGDTADIRGWEVTRP